MHPLEANAISKLSKVAVSVLFGINSIAPFGLANPVCKMT